VQVTATFARHETPTAPAPDAIGFLLDVGGVRIWNVADTEYDARLRPMREERIDTEPRKSRARGTRRENTSEG